MIERDLCECTTCYDNFYKNSDIEDTETWQALYKVIAYFWQTTRNRMENCFQAGVFYIPRRGMYIPRRETYIPRRGMYIPRRGITFITQPKRFYRIVGRTILPTS